MIGRMLLCLTLATLVLAVGAPHSIDIGIPGLSHLPIALGMIAPLIVPRTRGQLDELANPGGGKGVSQATPWILYDSQTYTSAATTTLNFFQTQQNDRTLSNLLQGGALTDPNYFEIYNLGFDILQDGSAVVGVTEVGIADDVQKLMLVGRPIFTLTIQDKNYGPFPLSFLHTSGGVQASIAAGNTAATGNIQFANNSFPDGGWNWRGSVIIQPKVGFSVQVQWTAAQTLAAGNPVVRFWMAGALHRAVV